MRAGRALLAAAVAAAGMLPAAGDGPVPSDPASPVERFVPRPAGVEKAMTLWYGPYTIPAGQDLNRFTLDVPLHGGFITAVAPNLLDATTLHEPSDFEMHIHHAHWLRISNDPEYEYYYQFGPGGLSWVFGTGEEQTQGSVDERAAADPAGPRYGIYVKPVEPNLFVYMLHNKTTTARTVYVTLDVRFVYGSAEAIASASCADIALEPGEQCAGGETFHHLTGVLWGRTFDVPREAGGDGRYEYPTDRPGGDSRMRHTVTATSAGTAVVGAGHLHPNGMEVVVANIGPPGRGCEADLDGDGFAGTTIMRSRKFDRVDAAWPHSEDYQMGITRPGWRAPFHEGDRLVQFGVYDNGAHASYEAMSFAGIYVDRAQAPPALPASGPCSSDWFRPALVDGDTSDPVSTIPNRAWDHAPLALCGLEGYAACDGAVEPRGPGQEAKVVHITGFAYLPGDQNYVDPVGSPPRVPEGEPLVFVNEDAALGIRHTVTSCPWPCNGPYVANYPQPDGRFDSGKLGNLDYIDGGLVQPDGSSPFGYGLADDTVPVWETPTGLAPGLYAYYCRIHPTMRGAFEVVAAG